MNKCILIILWVLAYGFTAWGQSITADTTVQWMVFHTGNSPLPDNRVTALASDETGAVWVGCVKKLLKYDPLEYAASGKTLVACGKPSSFFSFGGEITCLTTSLKREVWLGCANGRAAVYDDQEWVKFTPRISALPGSAITAMTADAGGNVWFGTRDSGLVRFNEGQWKLYKQSDTTLPDNRITALAMGPDGNLWIASAKGLIQYDGDTIWKKPASENELPFQEKINSMLFDNQGTLWMGTGGSGSHSGGGVAVFRNKIIARHTPENSALPSGYITAFCTKENQLWIASSGIHTRKFSADVETFIPGGLAIFKGNELKNISSLFSGYLQTRYPSVHAGKYKGMLTREELIRLCLNVNTLAVDGNGNLWIGTDNGLFVYNKAGIKL